MIFVPVVHSIILILIIIIIIIIIIYQISKEEIASFIRSKALLINFLSHNDTLALNLH